MLSSCFTAFPQAAVECLLEIKFLTSHYHQSDEGEGIKGNYSQDALLFNCFLKGVDDGKILNSNKPLKICSTFFHPCSIAHNFITRKNNC